MSERINYYMIDLGPWYGGADSEVLVFTNKEDFLWNLADLTIRGVPVVNTSIRKYNIPAIDSLPTAYKP